MSIIAHFFFWGGGIIRVREGGGWTLSATRILSWETRSASVYCPGRHILGGTVSAVTPAVSYKCHSGYCPPKNVSPRTLFASGSCFPGQYPLADCVSPPPPLTLSASLIMFPTRIMSPQKICDYAHIFSFKELIRSIRCSLGLAWTMFS